MNLMLFSLDSACVGLYAVFMSIAAIETLNAYFASLRVLVFLQVNHEVSFANSSVETGAV